jgi:hypothetical protein
MRTTRQVANHARMIPNMSGTASRYSRRRHHVMRRLERVVLR